MMKLTLNFLVLLGLVFPVSSFADPIEFLGRCTWKFTLTFQYDGGRPLAEFFFSRETRKVYVRNIPSVEAGWLNADPRMPESVNDGDLTVVNNDDGPRNYKWDDGQSAVACNGVEQTPVATCSSSPNVHVGGMNMYASCLFVTDEGQLDD